MRRTKAPGSKYHTTKKIYNDEMPERAYRLCLLGVTNGELAIALGVSVQTIEYWIRTKPKFRRAVERGRLEADSKVAAALYKRAVGFKVREQLIKTVQNRIVRVPVMKYYPPDVTACEVWLRNRQRHLWTSVYKHEVTGKNGQAIEFKRIENITMNDVEDEVLDFLVEQALKIARKQENDPATNHKVQKN